MPVLPVLHSTNMANVAVELETDLATLPTQTYQDGTLIWSRDTEILWAFDSRSAAALVAGQSRPSPTGGAWLAVASSVTAPSLNMTSVVGPAGAGGAGTLRGTIPNGPITAIPKGFETTGDVGGGLWFWDSTSVLADDANLTEHTATIIQPTAVVGAGRWRRIVLNPLGLLSFDMAVVGQRFEWQASAVAPGLRQINHTSGAFAAENMLIQAQANTVAGQNGGNVDIKAGDAGAGGTDGSIRFFANATDASAGDGILNLRFGVAGATVTSFELPAASTQLQFSLSGKNFIVNPSNIIALDTVQGLLRDSTGASIAYSWTGSKRSCIAGDVLVVLAGTDGVGVEGIANATTVPTVNPVGGGVIYATAGALTYRGSGGTVTTIAPA